MPLVVAWCGAGSRSCQDGSVSLRQVGMLVLFVERDALRLAVGGRSEEYMAIRCEWVLCG